MHAIALLDQETTQMIKVMSQNHMALSILTADQGGTSSLYILIFYYVILIIIKVNPFL